LCGEAGSFDKLTMTCQITHACREVIEMAKIWIQNSPCPWGYDGAVTCATCVTSGSFSLQGYSRLTGIVYADEALDPSSGVVFQQSVDGGTNWDLSASTTVAASTAASFNYTLAAKDGRILVWATSNKSATSLRSAWRLWPI
jgi:hypothetical protein